MLLDNYITLAPPEDYPLDDVHPLPHSPAQQSAASGPAPKTLAQPPLSLSELSLGGTCDSCDVDAGGLRGEPLGHPAQAGMPGPPGNPMPVGAQYAEQGSRNSPPVAGLDGDADTGEDARAPGKGLGRNPEQEADVRESRGAVQQMADVQDAREPVQRLGDVQYAGEAPSRDHAGQGCQGDRLVDPEVEAVPHAAAMQDAGEAPLRDCAGEGYVVDPQLDPIVEMLQQAADVQDAGEAPSRDCAGEGCQGNIQVDPNVEAVLQAADVQDAVEAPSRDPKVEAVRQAPDVQDAVEAPSRDPKVEAVRQAADAWACKLVVGGGGKPHRKPRRGTRLSRSRLKSQAGDKHVGKDLGGWIAAWATPGPSGFAIA
jgi:hypothetical protein